MSKLIIFIFVFILFISAVKFSEARSYNFGIKSYRSYSSGGSLYYQRGYVRRSTGTYVMPHFKTKADNTIYNNRRYILGY